MSTIEELSSEEIRSQEIRSEEIRRQVSRRYEAAMAGGTGCCGPRKTGSGCCASGSADHLVAQTAGYRDDELASLPPDVAADSFGCGNPLAFSEVREGEVVLDLGSGAGLDLLLASRRVGPGGRVIGVDMTEAMVLRARKNATDAGAANVEVRQGLIERLPVESGSVDWVISNCVINLSPEKDRIFAEIHRVLKPGGRFVISDVVADGIPGFLRGSVALYNACVAGAIGEARYLEGLRQAGLADVGVLARTVYDRATLHAFAQAELEDSGPLGAILSRLGLARTAGRYLEGKVWSAKFHGRKPG